MRVLGDRPILPTRPGSFDHGDVHPASGRVFVTRTSAGTVEVLDPFPGGHTATIPDCPEGSGLLCTPDGGRVYAASRSTGRILEIAPDPKPRVSRTWKVGPAPNGLAWDPEGQRLLVADVRDNRARLYDADGGDARADEPLPGRPRWTLFDPVARAFYVNIRDPSGILVLEPDDLSLRRTFALSAQGAHGLGLDIEGRRAFVAADDAKLVAVDVESGREIAERPLSGPPDVVWLDPRRRRVYVSVGEPGRVDVFDSDSLRALESVPTELGAHTSALDAERGRLYAFLPETGAVRVLDTTEA